MALQLYHTLARREGARPRGWPWTLAAQTLSSLAAFPVFHDLEVVAELASGNRIVPEALQHHPDVALLDIDLPGTDGLTAAAELRERLPACRVLILTGLAAPDSLGRALAAGVSGFLIKDGPADDLVDAVRRVARGERVFASPPR